MPGPGAAHVAGPGTPIREELGGAPHRVPGRPSQTRQRVDGHRPRPRWRTGHVRGYTGRLIRLPAPPHRGRLRGPLRGHRDAGQRPAGARHLPPPQPARPRPGPRPPRRLHRGGVAASPSHAARVRAPSASVSHVYARARNSPPTP
nr:MAG TPA: hypothetical protein [Caudoviricetes sp.]